MLKIPRTQVEELKKRAKEQPSPLAHLFTLFRIWADDKTLYEKTQNEELGCMGTERLRGTFAKAIRDAGDAFRN